MFKSKWLSNSLTKSVTIFDMTPKITNSGVENVTQCVFSQK